MAIDNNKIWEIAKDMRVCMLTSWNGEKLIARPMTSNVMQDRHAIYFLDKKGSDKEKEIVRYPSISLSYQDHSSHTYLAISGHAKICSDWPIIEEIWSDFDKAFFESPQDPNICLITFTPEIAEVWQGPNKLVAGIKMIAAVVTNVKSSMGEQKKMAI